jgi:hypothetical protein
MGMGVGEMRNGVYEGGGEGGEYGEGNYEDGGGGDGDRECGDEGGGPGRWNGMRNMSPMGMCVGHMRKGSMRIGVGEMQKGNREMMEKWMKNMGKECCLNPQH